MSALEDVTIFMSAAEIEFSGTEGQIEQWKEETEKETEKAETETAQKRNRKQKQVDKH